MKKITLGLLALIVSTQAFAGVPYSFVSGTPAVASEVNANFNFLDLAISDLQTEQSTQDADISSNADDISTLQTDLFTLNLFATGTSNDLSSLSTTVSTQGTSLASLSTTVSGHTTSITSLQSSVSTITTDVSSAETAITTLQSDVSTLDAVVTANTDDVSLLESAVSSIETSITSIQSTITSIQTAIGTLETDVTGLDTRVATLESAPGACPAQSGEWFMDYLSYSYISAAPGTTLSLFGGVDNYFIQKLPVYDVKTGKTFVVTFPSSNTSYTEISFSNTAVYNSYKGDCFNDFSVNGYGAKIGLTSIFKVSVDGYSMEFMGTDQEPEVYVSIRVGGGILTLLLPYLSYSEYISFTQQLSADGSTADVSGLQLNNAGLNYYDGFIDYINVEEVTP